MTATIDARQSPDPLAAAIPAWRFAVHGDFNLDAFAGTLPWLVEGPEHVVSNRNPGVIFFGVPFYWLARPFSAELGFAPAAVAAAVASAGAMTVLHALFRRFVATSTAVAAALLAGMGTATWTVSADGLWPHGIGQLWLSLALLSLAGGRWLAGGGLFALAIFTRPQTAVVAAVAGCYHGWAQRSLQPVALVGAASACGAGAFLAYSRWMFGAASATGGYSHDPVGFAASLGVVGYAEAVAGTLVSPARGVLVLSPFLLMLIPGLRRAWRVAPGWVRAGALGALAYILTHLALIRFSGGYNFYSYRLPLESLTLAAPLLLLAWREWVGTSPLRARVFVYLAGFSVFVHALGAIFWSPAFERFDWWTYSQVYEAVSHAGWWTVPVLALVLAGVAVHTLRRRRGIGETLQAD